METIAVLPLELLYRVLHLAAEGERVPTRRYTLLRSTSLVNRNFLAESKALLWQKIYITTEERACKIISHPSFGDYATEVLEVRYWTNISAWPLNEILAKVEGLKYLSIKNSSMRDNTVLGMRHLNSPNLSGLISLRLKWISLNHIGISSLPFRLCNLYLGLIHPPISENAFSLFFNPSLTNFRFGAQFPVGVHQQLFLSFFETLAPQLENLVLDGIMAPFQHRDLLPGIVPLFALCEKLRHVDIRCDEIAELTSALEQIPAPLESITLYRWNTVGSMVEDLLQLPCMRNLARIYFADSDEQLARRVEPLLGRRGIEASYGFVPTVSEGW